MWHSMCTVQRPEAVWSGQADKAGTTGAQLLLWPLSGVFSAQPGLFLPKITVLEGREELGGGKSSPMPGDEV